MQTCHLIALMIIPLIIVAVIFYSPQAAPTFFKPPTVTAADPPPIYHQKCQKTTLYPLTFPPGKPEHSILCRPTGKSLQDANNMNIEFNKGLVAGQHSSLIKCPSGNKNICSGWDYAKKYLR